MLPQNRWNPVAVGPLVYVPSAKTLQTDKWFNEKQNLYEITVKIVIKDCDIEYFS